jgi:hypothetical protein
MIRRLLVRACSRSSAALRSVGGGSVVQRLPSRQTSPRRSRSSSRESALALLRPAARAIIAVENVAGISGNAARRRSGRGSPRGCAGRDSARGCPGRGSERGCPGRASARGCPGRGSEPGCPGLASARGCPPPARGSPARGSARDSPSRGSPARRFGRRGFRAAGAGSAAGADLRPTGGSSPNRARQLGHRTTGSRPSGRTTSNRRHPRPEWQTAQRRPAPSISVRSSVVKILLRQP